MNDISLTALECNLKYLKLLSRQYPTIASACTEIINLQSILNLPKGTEHFLTDIHGEYSAFTHVLKNASGVIKRKIEDIFGTTLRSNEKKRLATLIYYPELKLQHIKNSNEENNINDFYRITLYQLLELCRNVSSKYTRSKVRKALPVDFAYIIEELLQNYENTKDKHEYYNEIINTIISIDRADEFIIAISELIQQLVVDRLHILGDIYDRGPGPHIIIDELMLHHCVDIQWGNHDIVWLGAASGSIACIANVIRICIRYANLKILEEGYGINMLPLATFAMETYKDDPCTCFLPKMSKDEIYRNKELQLISQMHKAITIIQFKIEGALIKRRPDFEMNNRLLLDKIDYENGTITIDNISYPLLDCGFPTIDPKDPYKLSGEEEELINKLKTYFVNSEKLQKHAGFLYSKGSLYLNVNSNLLYHGCIPLNEDGSFKSVSINNDIYKGKSLLDKCDAIAREAFFLGQDTTITSAEKQYALDGIWYLWCGENSPLFGKDKMATFERYFISESEIHTEVKNPYFTLRNDESICSMILNEFNLDPLVSHIINGHVPVKANQGENPIKANGKLLVIDGGFSKAYQPETGIAGYTLIYNSYGLVLVSHEPFESTEKAITEEQDILSSTRIVESNIERKRVADTDIGFELINQIEDIKMLLCAYRKGLIKENS